MWSAGGRSGVQDGRTEAEEEQKKRKKEKLKENVTKGDQGAHPEVVGEAFGPTGREATSFSCSSRKVLCESVPGHFQPTQTEVLQPCGALYLKKQIEHGNQQIGLPSLCSTNLVSGLLASPWLPPADATSRKVRLFAFPAAPAADTINGKVRLCTSQLTRPLALSIAKTCDSSTNHTLFSTSPLPSAVGEHSVLPQPSSMKPTYLPLGKKESQVHERPRKTECVQELTLIIVKYVLYLQDKANKIIAVKLKKYS